MTIHVIGNSHACVFSTEGFKWYPDATPENTVDGIHYKVYYIGPIIAYNFYEKHYPKVLEIVEKYVDKETDYVMLMVGEVDCRLHLPKQVDEQKRSIQDITNECVTRFFRAYDDLAKKGYRCIAWGGHPSTAADHSDDREAPIFKDCLHRNEISRCFEKELKTLCAPLNIPCISLIDALIDPVTGLTKMDYFADYCHLVGEVVPQISGLIKSVVPT